MSFKLSRKAIVLGSSHLITLPYSWCQFYGDRVNQVTIYGDDVLVIAPQGLEKIAQRLIEGKKENII